MKQLATGLPRLAILLLPVILSACQSMPDQPVVTVKGAPEQPIIADTVQQTTADIPPEPAPPEDLWQQLSDELSLYKAHQNDPQVKKYRDRYLRHKPALHALLERASPYLYHIVHEVRQRQLPLALALLPAVESGFNATAYSPEHAGGLWQIIPSTARHLNLQINPWYDGRGDVMASTDAALNYLQTLHQRLDEDWLLALAAYNAGEYRVRKARRRLSKNSATSDFWRIKLPAETRNYVPRLLALCSIIAQAVHYQVNLPELPNSPWFSAVSVDRSLSLRRLAEQSGIPLAQLKQLNSGLLRWITPPASTTAVLIPVAAKAKFENILAKLPLNEGLDTLSYRVVAGDTLGALAQRFNTSVAAIKATNQLSGHLIRAGKTLRIPKGNDFNQLARSQQRVIRHRVKKGDSLWSIARRYKVSTRDLVRWNQLNPRRYLQLGQAVKIYVRSGHT